jgi:hypothetical protein
MLFCISNSFKKYNLKNFNLKYFEFLKNLIFLFLPKDYLEKKFLKLINISINFILNFIEI